MPKSLGWLALGGILAVLLAALIGLVVSAPPAKLAETIGDGEVWRILRFTLIQAGLSTLLSVVLAIPFARALARHPRFWGRRWLLAISSLALVTPTMVAVLGIAAVHGRSGWLNGLFDALGLPGYSLYGLNGILITHVFFNLPLATRVYLTALHSLPPTTWRLATHLGLSGGVIFRRIEWPVLRSVMPGVASLIFMLCFTSFAIVLTLGGGPKYATLEVAIYQALRFDFDLARGVMLAGVQITMCSGLLWMLHQTRTSFDYQKTGINQFARPDTQCPTARLIDTLVMILAALFLCTPLLAVMVKALTPALFEILGHQAFWSALMTSCLVASVSAVLALALSLPIAMLSKDLGRAGRKTTATWLELTSSVVLLVPPLTLGMGLFLILRPHLSLLDVGIYLVVLINALLAIPFVLKVLQPAINAQAEQVDRLCVSLGIRGWPNFWRIYWPGLRRSIALALALAITLSLGDMGVIALFGTQDFTTLPLLIYRLFGAYRTDEAAAVALLLCLLCVLTFWGLDRLIGGRQHA